MSDTDAAGAADLLFELGTLKRAKRTGWWIAGVKDPESIAEHSFRTAIIGTVLAAMEGADPARVALLCGLHDTQETRVGDIPHIGRRYVEAADNRAVTEDQTAACPDSVAEVFRSAVAEYEQASTREAIIARDADKLECLVQPWSTVTRAWPRSNRGSRILAPRCGPIRHATSPKPSSPATHFTG